MALTIRKSHDRSKKMWKLHQTDAAMVVSWSCSWRITKPSQLACLFRWGLARHHGTIADYYTWHPSKDLYCQPWPSGGKTVTAIACKTWDPSKGLIVADSMSPPYQLAGTLADKSSESSTQIIHAPWWTSQPPAIVSPKSTIGELVYTVSNHQRGWVFSQQQRSHDRRTRHCRWWSWQCLPRRGAYSMRASNIFG